MNQQQWPSEKGVVSPKIAPQMEVPVPRVPSGRYGDMLPVGAQHRQQGASRQWLVTRLTCDCEWLNGAQHGTQNEMLILLNEVIAALSSHMLPSGTQLSC